MPIAISAIITGLRHFRCWLRWIRPADGRARRHVWNYAYWLTGAAVWPFWGAGCRRVYRELGEAACVRTSTRTQITYLLQPANLFGIVWCPEAVAGILLARLLAFCCLTVDLRPLTRR